MGDERFPRWQQVGQHHRLGVAGTVVDDGDRVGQVGRVAGNRLGRAGLGHRQVGLGHLDTEDLATQIGAATRGHRVGGRWAGLQITRLQFYLNGVAARTYAHEGKVAARVRLTFGHTLAFDEVNRPTWQSQLARFLFLQAVAVEIIEYRSADSHRLEVAEGQPAHIHPTDGDGHRVRGRRACPQPVRFQYFLDGESARTKIAEAKVAIGVGELRDEGLALQQIDLPV